MPELWEEIDECSWYSVSPQGEVLNSRIGRIMSIRYTQSGVAMVGLSYNGSQNQRSVARLVAKAWLPVPEYDHFDTIIHLNGNRTDCRAENLMWRPRWFAIKYHQERDEFIYDKYAEGPFVLHETGEIFETMDHAATSYGLLGWPLFKCIFESQNDTDDVYAQDGVYPYGFHFGYYRPN